MPGDAERLPSHVRASFACEPCLHTAVSVPQSTVIPTDGQPTVSCGKAWSTGASPRREAYPHGQRRGHACPRGGPDRSA